MRHPLPLACLLIATLCCAGSFAPARGQSAIFRRAHHPWGRFQVGAWKRVRIVTEEYDQQGEETGTSTSEQLITLLAADDSAYTIEIDASVEVAGRTLDAPKQSVRETYLGVDEDQQAATTVKSDEAGRVMLEGAEVACVVRQLEENLDTSRRTTTLYYSETVAPYLLRVESETLDLESQSVTTSSRREVVAVGMPFRILDRIRVGSVIREHRRNRKGSTSRLQFTCLEVPGGVVAESTKEVDAAGRVIRRSTLEIIDYGLPEPGVRDATPSGD